MAGRIKVASGSGATQKEDIAAAASAVARQLRQLAMAWWLVAEATAS